MSVVTIEQITDVAARLKLDNVSREFKRLTLEEQDLYYNCYCFFCSKLINSQEEYNSHYCAAKAAIQGYYKDE